jgi:bla regulator protein blaR1
MNTPLTANAVLTFVIACNLKVTVVWAIAAIAAACLGRASAASRHFVWAAAVVASLALPVLSAALPGWKSTTIARAAEILAPASPATVALPSGFVSPLSVDAARSTFHPAVWLIALWALGAIALCARLLVGLIRIRAASGQASPMADSVWLQDLHAVANSLQIRRPVRLLESSSPDAMPLTWGWARPTIVLPLGATDWSQERRRIVLCHELAHISRGDWLLQICAEVSRAVYWFHPLAWNAAVTLRHESERACDDLVLNPASPPKTTPLNYSIWHAS